MGCLAGPERRVHEAVCEAASERTRFWGPSRATRRVYTGWARFARAWEGGLALLDGMRGSERGVTTTRCLAFRCRAKNALHLYLRSLRIALHDAEDVALGVFAVDEPANLWDRHFG